MHADLCMAVYRDAIKSVPLFKDVGVGFLRLLSLAMQPVVILTGEQSEHDQYYGRRAM
jgi:hypothetical protein